MNQSNPHLWLHLALLQLLEENQTDSLTGILNRRGFNEALQQQGAIALRYSQPLCLLLIDLCDLKKYNESEGYEAGDRILQKTAQILMQESRAADVLCRIGGDEFALLLPETELSAARTVEKRLQKELHNEGIEIHSGLACGEPDTLLSTADGILRESKNRGMQR
jgi:diguanylate cyclase (GGDEF)-like protein